jgi:hypothetical protein
MENRLGSLGLTEPATTNPSENVKHILYVSFDAGRLDELSGAFNARAILRGVCLLGWTERRKDILCQRLHLQ